ncbi:hypothetical protein [Aurantiacibacter poecillastricola]|uniref:hypothetical protein n=1 Tax=Aurantiacibacter poecillastricola TaxID=3064385 RepID=UPI00273E0023|nr:hypothetical protein [Aurantiacibacter sp. 219JJ12-13]MDP5261421.1 hypothetical protein [Aurantiacibacter sp. 219JJ12-13]
MLRLIAMGLGALLAALAIPAAAQVGGVPPEEQSCQRECLEGYVESYLQAMAEGNVSDALFARTVRFTENGVELPLGNEGLWATTSSAQGYRLVVSDVETQQVAALATVREVAGSSAAGPDLEAEPVGVALRLRIDADGRISEIEQIAARPERGLGDSSDATSTNPFPAIGAAVEALGEPWEGYLTPVPESERHTRAELIAIGNAYFEGLQRNDGQGYYPFSNDCLRIENGVIAAAPAGHDLADRPAFGTILECRQQFEEALEGVVTGVRDRRSVAVDPERGLVFAFGFFDHRPINWTWQIGELFKVENGEITRIEAIFIRSPYGMCSGWSTYSQCRSEEIQEVR